MLLYIVGGGVLVIGCVALWFHFTNPFAHRTIFQNPYQTRIGRDGQIEYVAQYQIRIYSGRMAHLLGYIKSGFLIVQNTFFGGKRAVGHTVEAITSYIHAKRFDPQRPYLISGDQFSVLYPRNLGVFYNQVLNPNTALNNQDWMGRQQIYLQSVLLAIDGLSASPEPRTTIVPMGPRHAVLTQVHPGSVGSDQVYGLFYAIQTLRTPMVSNDGRYRRQTGAAAVRILKERCAQLQYIYDSYIRTVYDPQTGLVRHSMHLASARDGVIRSSSLYDNIILHETIRLAKELGLKNTYNSNCAKIKRRIKNTYWNAAKGHYIDDVKNPHFSADWLIGFVTSFFDLTNKRDLERTIATVAYLEESELVQPFPIKYQTKGKLRLPGVIRLFVPSYGADAIWSYWGAQYITLLADLYNATRNETYLRKARQYCRLYNGCIVRDGGFAETFSAKGNFLRTVFYKSIRITGWIVQFEHAKYTLGIKTRHPMKSAKAVSSDQRQNVRHELSK